MIFPIYDDVPARRAPVVTVALILVNVASLIWLASHPPLVQQEIVARRGFIPARIAQFRDPALVVNTPLHGEHGEQLVLQLPADPREIALSLITMMFLHGGIGHLLGNMWFLWLFGDNVEDRLGHGLYLAFYLMGGLAAAACHWWSAPTSVIPVIGASGAIGAVLGAYAVTYPLARVRCLLFIIIFFTFVDLPALVVLGLWVLLQLLEAFGSLHLGVDGGVAWWAHVGGFAAGAALMPLLSGPPPRVRPPARRVTW